MLVRGKWLALTKHASQGLSAERPRIQETDVAWVLEEPDHDTGREAYKWVQGRTIIVRYREDEEEIIVRSVSATSRKLAT